MSHSRFTCQIIHTHLTGYRINLREHGCTALPLLWLYIRSSCEKTVREVTTTVELTPCHIPAAHDILKPRHSAKGTPVVKTNVDQAIATNQS